MEVRRTKPGFLLTRVFSRPKILAPFLCAARSRRYERPRSSRLVHSASFRARNLNKASMTLMLPAVSIKFMDALFGFLARNDAECCKRELLGRSWRRDRGPPKNGPQILGREKTLVKQNPGFARRTSTAQKISNQGWSKPGSCNFPILHTDHRFNTAGCVRGIGRLLPLSWAPPGGVPMGTPGGHRHPMIPPLSLIHI